MNKKLLYVSVISLVILIGGALAYSALRPKKTSPASPAQTTETKQPAQEQPAESNKGAYAAYDPAAIPATAGRKILFFHAAWCPQCRAIEKSILDGTIPKNVTIFKVNYDTATDLRQKYKVTLQTTMVEIDDQGNAIKSFVAYDTPSLQAVIDKFSL